MSEKHEKAEKRPAGLARWDPFGEIDLFDRWTPLRELMAPSSRLARLFEGVLGEAGRGTRGFAPAVDIDENDAQYTVTVEIPGGKKEDVQVEIEEGVLTIRGEKKSERTNSAVRLLGPSRKSRASLIDEPFPQAGPVAGGASSGGWARGDRTGGQWGSGPDRTGPAKVGPGPAVLLDGLGNGADFDLGSWNIRFSGAM